ncbi:Hint domain-containing protein [Jannaschia sp. Os4]|uniref:Hint domain-containing protein n=1 Tax=Jannaschia sp. Os4 TaxID=2807617 RepID=UPI001939BF0D|nr:Hint domain-containing protein [Jannaschia sp. Os4]MBM2576630.1 Hint domain-containing protein [Jannaschia sp. Os4]
MRRDAFIRVFPVLEFDGLDELAGAEIGPDVTAVLVGGVVYRLRPEEPPHPDFKAADADGQWWSPDYKVVVAAGQSNMFGSGRGGDLDLDPNVMTYDWQEGVVEPADYLSAPSGGPGLRSNPDVEVNNLYYPFANKLSAEAGQPVLVIARPVSGSKIETWLEGEAGVNWEPFAASVEDALAQVGQDEVDVFLWHQGESDHPDTDAAYRAKFVQLFEQVNAQDWAGDDLDVIVGELSREGVNAIRNRVLQEIEQEGVFENMAFASSVGLSASDDPRGVHFDGADLVAFGEERYWAAYEELQTGIRQDAGNRAPEAVEGINPARLDVTLQEGERFVLDPSDLFTDADGDELHYYVQALARGNFFYDQDGETITFQPGLEVVKPHQGEKVFEYELFASDLDGDGAKLLLTITVEDVEPMARYWRFKSDEGDEETAQGLADLAHGMDVAVNNSVIEILSQEALEAGLNPVTVNNLLVTGGVGLEARFQLADDVVRLYLGGAADFDVYGADRNNVILGNDGDNFVDARGGIDDVTLGGGFDHVVFENDGSERHILTVRDFDVRFDKIVLRNFGVDSFEEVRDLATFRDDEANDRLVIDFPDGGGRIVLDGFRLSDMRRRMFEYENGGVCIGAGALIDTPSGPVPVEALRAGDWVTTRDGPRPLTWVGAETVPVALQRRVAEVRPVTVAPHAFGPDRPARPLVLSQRHRVLLDGPACEAVSGEAEGLAAAGHLLSDGRVAVTVATAPVTYVHLLLDHHAVVFADGLPVETLNPGASIERLAGPAMREEIVALHPEIRRLRAGGYLFLPAAPLLKRHEAACLRPDPDPARAVA